MPARFLENLRRFVRRSAGPLLLVWMLLLVAYWVAGQALADLRYFHAGPASALLSWRLNALPGSTFFVTLAALVGLSAWRTALFAPADRLMQNPHAAHTVRGVLGASLMRVPDVVGVGLVTGIVSIACAVVCLIFNAPIWTWVEFPVDVALSPVAYFVVARRDSIGQALGRALSLWRRHWRLMVIVQGGLMLQGALVFSLIPNADGIVFDLRTATLLLGMHYTGWVARVALYYTLAQE